MSLLDRPMGHTASSLTQALRSHGRAPPHAANSLLASSLRAVAPRVGRSGTRGGVVAAAAVDPPATGKRLSRREEEKARKDEAFREKLVEWREARCANLRPPSPDDATGGAASPLELLWLQGAQMTKVAQAAWTQVLQLGDTVVDATCGNGNDTVALASLVGPEGRVFAFDIQGSALQATRERMGDELPSAAHPELRLVEGCHTTLQAVVGSGVARVVAFNLGYLPSGDKALTTTPATTAAALEAALETVAVGGLITVMCYTSHEGGVEELETVRAMAADLPTNYWISSEQKLLNRSSAPTVIFIWRRSDYMTVGRR